MPFWKCCCALCSIRLRLSWAFSRFWAFGTHGPSSRRSRYVQAVPALVCRVLFPHSRCSAAHIEPWQTASGLELHKAIFRHALATLIDLPYILLTLVTGVFFWRIPSLWTQFGKVSSPRPASLTRRWPMLIIDLL